MARQGRHTTDGLTPRQRYERKMLDAGCVQIRVWVGAAEHRKVRAFAAATVTRALQLAGVLPPADAEEVEPLAATRRVPPRTVVPSSLAPALPHAVPASVARESTDDDALIPIAQLMKRR